MTLVRSVLDYVLCPPILIFGSVAGILILLVWSEYGPTKISLIGEVDGCRVYEVRGAKTSYIATCGGQSVVAKREDRLQASGGE